MRWTAKPYLPLHLSKHTLTPLLRQAMVEEGGKREKHYLSEEAMLELGLQLSEQKQLRFVVVACVAVAVGMSLAPHLRSQALMKGFAKSLSVADGVVKGATAIRSPSPSNLFFFTLAAAKAFVKGAAKGKGKALFLKANKFKKMSKGLKVSEGALNVVRYSTVLHDGVADPFNLDHVIKGYKWTKGAFTLFQSVTARAGGYAAIKEGMKGVDVVVKTMALTKRVHGVLTEGFRVSHGIFQLLSDELKNNKSEEKHVWRRRARQQGSCSCLQS